MFATSGSFAALMLGTITVATEFSFGQSCWMYGLYASVPVARITRKSPLPLRWHIHWNAASTSVPPPISTVPGVVDVVTSFALPTRKYEYFLPALAGTTMHDSKNNTASGFMDDLRQPFTIAVRCFTHKRKSPIQEAPARRFANCGFVRGYYVQANGFSSALRPYTTGTGISSSRRYTESCPRW